MTTTTRPVSELTAAIVNPLMMATNDVFSMMLGCKPSRDGLSLKTDQTPTHELSAVIGVTGKAVGTIVFSVDRGTAFAIVDRMLGIEVTEINAEVRDAVGEVTNMIAGAAKA
ncbi:MAG: chemotaxis protein CheX, partial [Planctomycetaceae bacterium]|nr:chemotaxis protein CheX [Planctomycetaceae bacterium]